MSSALFFFRLLWPFLKELFLGGLSLKEGMRTQKKKVFLLLFVSGLILSAFLITPKLFQLSQEHAKTNKPIKDATVTRLENRVKELEEKEAKAHALPVKVSPAAQVESQKTPDPVIAPVAKMPAKITPKLSKHRAIPHPLPHLPADDEKVIYDRKKAYMDFFDKYDD